MKKLSLLLLLAASAVLAACANSSSTPSGKPVVITAEVNDHLRGYMHEIDAGRSGAFAVNEAGNASFYYYCEHGGCHGLVQFSAEAIRRCENFGRGRCFILAHNGVIKRPYTVGTSAEALQQALEQALGTTAQPQKPAAKPEPIPGLISGARMRTELAGNSIIQKDSAGKIWAEYFDPNGTLRGHDTAGRRFGGSWTIEGDTLCVDYTSIAHDWCGQFAEASDGSIDRYDENRWRQNYPRSVLQKGNPEQL
jgi:hypothetical protein